MYGIFLENINKKGDKFGFVDEYKVRVGAWIYLLLSSTSFIMIAFFGHFLIPSILVAIIFLDFLYKSFISPNSIFFGKLTNYIRNKYIKKDVYYVGALQKRFTWRIGLFLATFVFACILIVSGFLAKYGIAVEAYNISQTMYIIPGTVVPFTPPLIACLICILFMFLEAVFGYCVGCKIYSLLIRFGIIKKVQGQNCVNGSCEI